MITGYVINIVYSNVSEYVKHVICMIDCVTADSCCLVMLTAKYWILIWIIKLPDTLGSYEDTAWLYEYFTPQPTGEIKMITAFHYINWLFPGITRRSINTIFRSTDQSVITLFKIVLDIVLSDIKWHIITITDITSVDAMSSILV